MKAEDFFRNMKLDYEHCFLCGLKLDKVNTSEEHIFPKWLQKRFNLWNQTLKLINDSLIQYRQLKVPCCKECNNQYLSTLEKEIDKATTDFISFEKIDKNKVFLWLVKLYYGLQFKNLSLYRDLKDKDKGKSSPDSCVKCYTMFLPFLLIKIDVFS